MTPRPSTESSYLTNEKDELRGTGKRQSRLQMEKEMSSSFRGRASSRYPQMEDENLESEFWNF